MLYRNVKTGAEIETNSIILAPNWIQVGAVAPKKAVEAMPPKADPVEIPVEPEVITPEPEKVPEVKKEDPKPVKKTAPKKTVKRTKK